MEKDAKNESSVNTASNEIVKNEPIFTKKSNNYKVRN
jgi:hypothetical protein